MEQTQLETPKQRYYNNLIKYHLDMRDESKEHLVTHPRCILSCNTKNTRPREVRTLKKIVSSEIHQHMKYTVWLDQINRLDNYILTRYCWKNLNIPENLKRELEDSYNNCLKHKNSIVTRQPVNDVSTEIFIVKDSPTYRRLKRDKILNQAELEKYFLRFQLWSKIRYRYPLHILNDLIPQLIQDIRARRNNQ